MEKEASRHEEEHPLAGGNITGGVVRVGDTVRRPQGDAAEGIHALLRHLEKHQVLGVSRLLGVDEQGREMLSYHPGVTIWPHRADLLGDDGVLRAVALLARRFHDASALLPIPAGVSWWEGSRDPRGGNLLLHGDFAPWNVVVGDDRLTLIDWDTAVPGRVEWELAYVLHTFVPFFGELAPDAEETVRRIRVFADGYGLDDDSTRLAMSLVPDRCRRLVAFMYQEANAEVPAFVTMVAEGHDAVWLGAADHVEAQLPTWFALLSR